MKGFYQIKFFLVILISFTSSLKTKRQGFVDLSQLSQCRTPLGDIGFCLSIKQCKSLMDLLLKERHRPEVTNFLRASVCGYENRDPKVCCTEIPDISIIIRQPPTTSAPKPPPPPQPATTSPPPVNHNNNNNENKYSVFPRPLECGTNAHFNLRVVGGTNASLGIIYNNKVCVKWNLLPGTFSEASSITSFYLVVRVYSELILVSKKVSEELDDLGTWPWIVALGYRSTRNPETPSFLCGGSLINHKHVLTAAHCVYNKKTLYMVRVGDLNLYSDDDGANPVNVLISRVIIHEKYNPTTFVNDIAVVRLQKPVQYDKLIKPICLPIDVELRSRNLVNRKPFVAGWGTTSFNGPSSAVLQQLQLPVVSEAECKRAFLPFKTATIDERVVCAGYLRGGKDACKGDSGGPLMDYEFVNKAGVFYQVGVVSYGYKCAEPGFPGVYTKVASFIDWIADALQE